MFDGIDRGEIRIYTETFKTFPVEALHAETSDPPSPLNLRESVLRFLYKYKSNH